MTLFLNLPFRCSDRLANADGDRNRRYFKMDTDEFMMMIIDDYSDYDDDDDDEGDEVH